MANRGDLKPFSVWRHKASKSLYAVLGIARCSTNGESEGEEAVVYISITYQHLCYREISEFLDGRFEPFVSVGSRLDSAGS